MRVAVDTNVLVYAEGVNDTARREQGAAVMDLLGQHEFVFPVQVAGELFRVLRRKMRMTVAEAHAVVASWQDLCVHQPGSTPETLDAAFRLVAAHGLDIWDALIVNAAADANCRLLLSEDMADGFVWRGVTVANPFAPEPHPLFTDLLNERPR